MSIRVINTTTSFALPLPNDFARVDPASSLSNRITKNLILGAFDVSVYSLKKGVVLNFSVKGNHADDQKCAEVERIVMSEVRSVASIYNIKV